MKERKKKGKAEKGGWWWWGAVSYLSFSWFVSSKPPV